ncbi:DUF2790 domain-containing protein [Pseudomonas syringae]|uniref:DUF2790 domain-containing protein n=1 Tax=Pseudomonas syringae TaxID=317 RepID=UPI00215B4468|nr:DUF2790 domain-containing protein [Pseudomonas syringae]MCR8718342.1 DUF2790 domain-containing protein [Pseudomonas syringae]
MRIIKSIAFVLAVCAPVAAYAFANDDSAIKEVSKEHQVAVKEYAEKNSKQIPVVVEYKYGMDMDIAKVIRTSPEMRLCKVVPQLMTYEDSKGDLNTVQYQVLSRCRGKN